MIVRIDEEKHCLPISLLLLIDLVSRHDQLEREKWLSLEQVVSLAAFEQTQEATSMRC